MSIFDKIESAYLTILRLVVLAVATVALVSAIVLGISAASKLVKPGPAQTPVTLIVPEKLPTLDEYVAENNPTADRQDSANNTAVTKNAPSNPDLDAAVGNLSKYMREVLQEEVGEKEVRTFLVSMAEDVPEEARNAYFKSVNGFSVELSKKADEQKALVAKAQAATQEPEEVPGIIDVNSALQWHLSQFSEASYKSKAAAEQNAVSEKIDAMTSLYMAIGAFATFLMVIFLFIIIKIERNLRGISCADKS